MHIQDNGSNVSFHFIIITKGLELMYESVRCVQLNMLWHVALSLVRSFVLLLSSTTHTWITTLIKIWARNGSVYRHFAEKWTSAHWYVYFHKLFLRETFLTMSKYERPKIKNAFIRKFVFHLSTFLISNPG